MFKESYFLYKRKIKSTIRQPIWVVMSLTTPLLYMLLFAPLLQGVEFPTPTTAEVMNSFVPGLLTLLAFGAGISGGWDVLFDLKDGVLERFRVTPARRFSLLLGTVMHDVTMFLVPSLFILIVALLFGFTIHIGGLIVLLVLLCLLAAICSAWSASMALILKEQGGFAALMQGLQLPLTLLSGILLPLSYGPKWLEILGHLNPLYYTVNASRVLATGSILSSPVIIAFAIFIPLTILTMLWSTRVFRNAIK